MGTVRVNGKLVDMTIVLLCVDEEIREKLQKEMNLHNEQAFCDEYAERHEIEYGVIFDVEQELNRPCKSISTEEFMIMTVGYALNQIIGDYLPIPPLVIKYMARPLVRKWEQTHESVTNEEAMASCITTLMQAIGDFNNKLLKKENKSVITYIK